MNDPITTHRPRPVTTGLLLKAAVVIPDVIISSLLWLVIIAALPPAVGFGVTVAGVAIGVLLAAGLGEDTAVRLLYRARRANPAEAPRLTVAWRIATRQMDADGVRLRIVTHSPPIATAGRRHLLLSREAVDAYCANDVTTHAVAALITEGIGRIHHGHTRFDLLWTFWTLPWDFIRGIAHEIGRRLAWIPLVQLAWRTRFIVGTIAVVLEAQAGRWPSPIIIGAFIVLSYLMPRWRRSWSRHLQGAAIGTARPLPFEKSTRSKTSVQNSTASLWIHAPFLVPRVPYERGWIRAPRWSAEGHQILLAAQTAHEALDRRSQPPASNMLPTNSAADVPAGRPSHRFAKIDETRHCRPRPSDRVLTRPLRPEPKTQLHNLDASYLGAATPAARFGLPTPSCASQGRKRSSRPRNRDLGSE